MAKREKSCPLQLAELKREIARGIEQAERGKLISGEEVFKNLRARNEKATKKK